MDRAFLLLTSYGYDDHSSQAVKFQRFLQKVRKN